MRRFVLQRVAATIPVMLVASLAIFAILRLAPGDPAAVIAGERATAAQIERIRAELGFDRPFLVQYASWLGRAARGDLGASAFSGQPVGRMIAQRLEPTLSLAAFTLSISVVVSLALGVGAAAGSGGAIDRTLMAGSVLGFSVPPFVTGYLLVFLFAIRLGWLPVQGYRPIADGIGPWLLHLVMPVATLCTGYVALIARVVRTSMLEALGEDYVRTARAKGLKESAVVWRHALGNAAIPIVTIVGIGFGLLIGGVAVTETVFNIPGVGRLTVDAIARRDYAVIQGVVFVSAAAYVAINLAIDLSYGLFDPRIQTS